jgi:hypothetical protein
VADVIAARVVEESPIDVERGTTAIGFATPVDIEGRPIAIIASKPLSGALPAGIRTWLDRIEARIATAERLCAVADLSAAADAVAELGGLSAVETLAAKIERDRRLAADLAVVPESLGERLEAIDIPVTAFARIARGGSRA